MIYGKHSEQGSEDCLLGHVLKAEDDYDDHTWPPPTEVYRAECNGCKGFTGNTNGHTSIFIQIVNTTPLSVIADKILLETAITYSRKALKQELLRRVVDASKTPNDIGIGIWKDGELADDFLHLPSKNNNHPEVRRRYFKFLAC